MYHVLPVYQLMSETIHYVIGKKSGGTAPDGALSSMSKEQSLDMVTDRLNCGKMQKNGLCRFAEFSNLRKMNPIICIEDSIFSFIFHLCNSISSLF